MNDKIAFCEDSAGGGGVSISFLPSVSGAVWESFCAFSAPSFCSGLDNKDCKNENKPKGSTLKIPPFEKNNGISLKKTEKRRRFLLL